MRSIFCGRDFAFCAIYQSPLYVIVCPDNGLEMVAPVQLQVYFSAEIGPRHDPIQSEHNAGEHCHHFWMTRGRLVWAPLHHPACPITESAFSVQVQVPVYISNQILARFLLPHRCSFVVNKGTVLSSPQWPVSSSRSANSFVQAVLNQKRI